MRGSFLKSGIPKEKFTNQTSWSRPVRTEQIVDDSALELYQDDIQMCFEHFKMRILERYSQKYSIYEPGDSSFTYKEYIASWVRFLRGYFVSIDTDGRMIRSLGDYIRDPYMYRVVYSNVSSTNTPLYVPLTIYKIEDKKRRLHDYKRLLLMKRLNKVN